MPYDPEIPLICLDEQPIQLLDDSRPSEPIKPGQVQREDYEYVRKGSCSVFLFTEPLAGWRHESLAKRLEIHYTPKHGSWLNMAEIVLSSMTIQCLDRRMGSIEQLQCEITAWEIDRNQAQKSVEWHFTTPIARGKLKYLYPEI